MTATQRNPSAFSRCSTDFEVVTRNLERAAVKPRGDYTLRHESPSIHAAVEVEGCAKSIRSIVTAIPYSRVGSPGNSQVRSVFTVARANTQELRSRSAGKQNASSSVAPTSKQISEWKKMPVREMSRSCLAWNSAGECCEVKICTA